jgi:hypothetical protein
VVRGIELLDKIQPNEAITAVKILRIGKAATDFRADQGAFDALLAKGRKYTGETEPPRARGFTFKLANFERATGVKLYGRVAAKFVPSVPGQKPGEVAESLARSLGIAQEGVLAIYFADIDTWGLWIGDSQRKHFTGSALEDAKQALYTAEATKAATPDKPVTAAQKIKYSVDAVLDALILKLEPMTRE